MALNLILPFAQGGSALVQSQAAYLADAQRPNGNQPGTARPDFVNKALRQASVMAAGIAQFLADNQGTDVDDTLLAAAISTMMSNATKKAAQSPPGTIVWIPGTSPLPNTVKLNGSLLTRTTYSGLWTYANVSSGNMAASDGAWTSGQFSPGDGTTTFRVPDARGYHLRAWDDGRGIDAARAIGSVQADQLLQHSHTYTDPGHAHTYADPGHFHGFNSGGTGGAGYPVLTNGNGTNPNTFSANVGITINGSAVGITINNSSGGAEVRVKNIAWMPVIYY